MSTRPTLQEVADLAGVSIGTASRVMNNKPNVLPETRERVLAAAEELGYQTPGRASTSSLPMLSTIGALSTLIPHEDAPANPFYGTILSGIDEECRCRNIQLMYAGFNDVDHDDESHWPPLLHASSVDGLLIMGHLPEDLIERIAQRTGKALVLIDAYADPNRFDRVLADNLEGAYRAVSYLIELGHRHIGLIGYRAGAFESFEQRRDGYRRALTDHGITTEYIGESFHHDEAIYEATLDLLRNNPQITAIFACLDIGAIAAIRAATALGLDVPGDLSVMGFDDIAAARSSNPPLTTMHTDIRLMGTLGVRQLIDRAQDPDRIAMTVYVCSYIVERQSTRAL